MLWEQRPSTPSPAAGGGGGGELAVAEFGQLVATARRALDHAAYTGDGVGSARCNP